MTGGFEGGEGGVGWGRVKRVVGAGVGLGWLIWARRSAAVPKLRTWRAWVVWGLEALLIALVLLLLWEPAITVAELSSQQNIIAVLVDDSRSMGIADSGSDGKQTREAAAVKALQDGVLAGLQKRFQTRGYRLDSKVGQGEGLEEVQAGGAATHITDGFQHIAAQPSDLPVVA